MTISKLYRLWFLLLVPPVSIALAGPPPAPKSDQALIESAMSAAPASVSKDAAVVDMSGGKMRTLRKGTNGWTCTPDDPGTPGDDPMCLDPNGWDWLMALMANKPPADKVGFIYMLKGGSDASNVDPAITTPKDGRWVTTGPHVMVVGPPAKLMPGYIKGDYPDTSKPYVMWAGSPYGHLMIPVKP